MIVHYNLLMLTRNADVTEIYFRCRKIYAELELALPFLHNAEVYRCETARDANADIMMAVHLDGPEYLNDFLHHPKYLALVDDIKDYVMDSMAFDGKEAC